jgi:phage gpG-like protein
MLNAKLKVIDTATPAIRGLVDWANDLSQMMDEMSRAFETNVRLAFVDSTDPYGNAWKPLSAVTIAKRRNNSSVIGRDTNRLMNSMLAISASNTAGVETNVVYARAFHFGAKQGQYGRTSRNGQIPWGDVPSRPILPLDSLPESWKSDIDSITIAYADTAWG